MAQYASTSSVSRSTPAAHRYDDQGGGGSEDSGRQGRQGQQGQQGQHKRVYQACIPCRRRKVRCDLGSVDNPSDPPCVRCRRESKECFFSATRRKRKTDDADASDADEYTVRNGRKRANNGNDDDTSPVPVSVTLPDHHRHHHHHHHTATAGGHRRQHSDGPLTPGGSHGRTQPLVRPGRRRTGSSVRDASELGGGDDDNQHMENPDAQNVMRPRVYGLHDALDLLAAPGDPMPPRPSIENTAASSRAGHHARRRTAPSAGVGGQHRPHHPHHRQPVDPGLREQDLSGQPGYDAAIKAWSRFRFVRAGWFTPVEAIDYIAYYYRYLSPLTPISPPTFSDPAKHVNLLTEEPILSVTLLTIASRYKLMGGTGGHCRSHAIHEQLWTYLRGMIERCLWGQEAFGGGFCGSGSATGSTSLTMETESSSTAPWRGMRKGSLRTLGTIESLLILTEWHPRALHFPPSEVTDELMLPDYGTTPNPVAAAASAMDDGDQSHNVGAGFGGKRLESWLEPAWRSDRMCWMLLSTAMGLGYELGIFDDIDELLRDDVLTRPEYQDPAYRQRASRIKRLLLIYTSQLAGRLGWTSMAPEHMRRADPALSWPNPAANGRNGGGENADMPSSSTSGGLGYVLDLELDDQIIHCWAGISNTMHLGNEKLFRSHKHTANIIQTGQYENLLREFGPLLRGWMKEFEHFRLPPFLRHILTIEYEYVRIYINSLSLQAVVERCTSNANHPAGAAAATAATAASAHGGSGNAATAPSQLSPQTIQNFGKLPLGQLGGFTLHDQESVREVVEGCRNLLRTVVEGLLPGDYLKHAPVRTYFRIISGAMFLLKTFALGAPRSDVKLSIDLMDATVDALRTCVVDDVHLGIRFADLLETLTSRLRNRFIQAPTMQEASAAAGTVTGSGARTPVVPTGAVDVGGVSDGSAGWSGRHAQNLREELNSRHSRPKTEGDNISATPFDLSTGNFPYPGIGLMVPTSTEPDGGDPGPHEQQHATLSGSNVDSSSATTTNAATATATGTTAAAAAAAAAAATGNNSNGHVPPTGIDAAMFEEWNNPDNEMWYLPTGPAFFQNMEGGSVSMTAEGVNVGGLDLLDYMVMDPAASFPDI
ncbi:Fungal Zn(2)-Cys(6) binuclear cluster domain, partial [Geosmithia morbida]